jgi:hypothetical protein
VPSATEVIQAENNRVPEPANADFIVMTPLLLERLDTNETDFTDGVMTGAIALTVLTISHVTRGALAVGNLVADTTGDIAANTIIVAQLTGTPGGVGTYTVSISQTVASETMYVGVRADLVATKWTVQLDIHGPSAADNVRVIDTLFRSEVGTDAFTESGFDIAPLYCNEARQMPAFVNAEQQYEWRWSMDACMQVNPIVSTPQQFADTLTPTVIVVDAAYPA